MAALTHVVSRDIAIVHRGSGLGVKTSTSDAVVRRRCHKHRETMRVVQALIEAARLVDFVEETHVRELHHAQGRLNTVLTLQGKSVYLG